MAPLLPRPRVISVISRRDTSGYWVNIFYDPKPLTEQQVEELGHQLHSIVPVAQLLRHHAEDGTWVEMELDRAIPETQLVEKYLALLVHLQPRYRSCIAEVRIATAKGPRHSVSLALFTVIVMFPPDIPLVVGALIEQALRPLGDKVGYLPNIKGAADNVYWVAVQPCRSPEKIGVFLSEALHAAGLDLVTWKQFDIPVAQYLDLLRSRKDSA